MKIIYKQRNVHESNITRPKAHLSLAVRWCQVLEQLDFMTIRRFQYSELELSTCDSGDLFRYCASLMRGMRKLKAEHIAPECQRALEIRNGDPGVIGRDDAKIHHAKL